MIIFLYGENDFLAKRKLKELKNKFFKEVDKSKSSFDCIDGENFNIVDLKKRIGFSSLFAKKRMLVIKDLFLNKDKKIFDELIVYFQKDNDNIIIFLETSIKSIVKNKKEQIIQIVNNKEKKLNKEKAKYFTFLKKQKFVQEFKKLNNLEINQWIKNEVENKGGKIEKQACQSLNILTLGNLWQISNEIDKLISLKQKEVIKTTDIENNVLGVFAENIFAFTDAISSKNKFLALNLLEEQVFTGLSDMYILTMLIRQFKIMIQIRQALDLGKTYQNIVSELKLHPFIIHKTIRYVQNFNLVFLKKFLKRLIEIDYKNKTGQGQAKEMMEFLINKAL